MKAVPLYSIYNDSHYCIFSLHYKVLESDVRDYMKNFNELKIVRILSGKGIWMINNIETPVEKDDIVLLSHSDYRIFRGIPMDFPITMEQIIFLPITVYPNLHCTDIFYSRPDGFCNRIDRSSVYHKEILDMFDKISRETKLTNSYKNEYILSMLTPLLILISRTYNLKTPPLNHEKKSGKNENYRIICDAITYINHNLYEDLSLPALSKKFCLSSAYFSRLFQEFNGIKLHEYVLNSRITGVIDLLNAGSGNVLDAAFQCGFTSASGFYKAFKKVTGTTPLNKNKN